MMEAASAALAVLHNRSSWLECRVGKRTWPLSMSRLKRKAASTVRPNCIAGLLIPVPHNTEKQALIGKKPRMFQAISDQVPLR